MIYKLSKYVYEVKSKNMWILYSTKSGGIVILSLSEYNELHKYLDNFYQNNEINKNSWFKKMVLNGFLVLKDEEETEEIINRYFDSVYQKKIFHLTVFVTDDCNFNCFYCFVNKSSHKEGYNIWEVIPYIISKKIDEYDSFSVSWFGGEPLLRYHELAQCNKKIMELCKKHNKTYSNYLVTNGYYLDVQCFMELYTNGVRNIQVTFDGDKKKHDLIRFQHQGESSFDKILNNLRKISKTDLGHFFIQVRCNYIVRDNNESVKNFINKMEKYFGNDYRFSINIKPIVNYNLSKEEENNYGYRDRVYSVFDIIKDRPRYAGWLIDFLKPRKYFCDCFDQSSYVLNHNGEIFLCDSVVNNNHYNLGNVDFYGKIQWKIPQWDRKELRKHILNEWGSCRKCKRLPICFGSCYRYFREKGKKVCYITDAEIKFALIKYVELISLLENKGE